MQINRGDWEERQDLVRQRYAIDCINVVAGEALQKSHLAPIAQQLGELVGGERMTKRETLDFVAALRTQKCQLFIGLYAFC